MGEEVSEALLHIPAHDRDTWLRVGMALHAMNPTDHGLALWRKWSQTAPNFREDSLVSSWRSFRVGNGVGAGTLWYLARQAGWRPATDSGRTARLPAPPKIDKGAVEAKEAALRRRQETAAVTARSIMAKCEMTTHPYLIRKGFAGTAGLVAPDGRLVIPVCQPDRSVSSLQLIDADGVKKFLPGGKVGGGSFRIGSEWEAWVCEGYATALSVRRALRELGRQVSTVVAFSAGNLPAVAADIRQRCNRTFVVADNDLHSGAGEKAARKTGLRWWMPPVYGDANDFEQARGIDALAQELLNAIMS